MRRRRSRGRDLREVLLARGDEAGLLDPVFRERRLQAVDDRSGDAQARVAELLLVPSVAAPLVGHTEAADVAAASVEDHQLAVVAVNEPGEVPEAQRMEMCD